MKSLSSSEHSPNATMEAEISYGGNMDPGSLKSTRSSVAAVTSPVSLPSDTNTVTVAAPPVTHALVRLGRIHGVYYVPEKIRSSIKIGELVLVEAAHGENTGTLVADVSAEVRAMREGPYLSPYLASVIAEAGARGPAAQAQALDDVLCPEEREVSTTAPKDPAVPTATVTESESTASLAGGKPRRHRFDLYGMAALSGLPEHDNWLQRLPCVLRRGVNKDKKKVYFSRKRDAEALQLASKIISEKNWGNALAIADVSYQVDFAAITITLRGGDADLVRGSAVQHTLGSSTATHTDESATRWSAQTYAAVASMLTSPLRTVLVEFRFSVQFPELAHLTRRILGAALDDRIDSELRRYERVYATRHAEVAIATGALPTGGGGGCTASCQAAEMGAGDSTSSACRPQVAARSVVLRQSPQQQQQLLFATATEAGTFTSQPPYRSPYAAPQQPVPLMPVVMSADTTYRRGSEDSTLSISASMSFAAPSSLWVSQQHPMQRASLGPQGPLLFAAQHQHQEPQGTLRLASFPSIGSTAAPQSTYAMQPNQLYQLSSQLQQTLPQQHQQQREQYQYRSLPPSQHGSPKPEQQSSHHQIPAYYYVHSQLEGSGNASDSMLSVNVNVPMGTPLHGHPHPHQQQQQQQIIYMVAGPHGGDPANSMGRLNQAPQGMPATHNIPTVHVFPNYGHG